MASDDRVLPPKCDILVKPPCNHPLCPSHHCIIIQASSNNLQTSNKSESSVYPTVQTTCTLKPVDISSTSQSGILLIVQLINEECLRTEPTQYELSLLSILHEFYNDNTALEIFKTHDLVKILIEALAINRTVRSKMCVRRHNF